MMHSDALYAGMGTGCRAEGFWTTVFPARRASPCVWSENRDMGCPQYGNRFPAVPSSHGGAL